MDYNYYSKNLDSDEEMIRIVRQHPIVLAKTIIINGLIILLDFFFIAFLFAKGLWGIIVFLVFLIFPSFFIFRRWRIWANNVFIITSKRVIDVDQNSLFSKEVSECNYEKIQDVSFTIKGIFATLFNFGEIRIQTAGTQANLEIRSIKDPQRIQEIITDAQREAYQRLEGGVSDKELEDAITKVKKRLDERTLRKLFKDEKD